MGSRGIAIRADEERRQEVPESFVVLLYWLAIQGVTQTDEGELRRDIGAVDLPAEAGAEPGEEVADMVRVCVGKEERVQGLRWNREAVDIINGVVAFALEQAAIDREALTAGGVIDEVGRAGNRTAGTEGLIEERRGRARVMGGQPELHSAGQSSGGIGGRVFVKAKGRDGLRRVEQFGEFVEVGHRRMEVWGVVFGTTAHARPRKEVR